VRPRPRSGTNARPREGKKKTTSSHLVAVDRSIDRSIAGPLLSRRRR
jgi:hypothetical protein